MKKYLVILVLLFTTNAWSAPSSSLSIAPVAVDAAVIEASDENTRNSAITTWANAHDHTDISTVGNTLSVGDGTAGNKTIQANNADGTKPFIRYDDTNNRWVISQGSGIVDTIVVMTGNTVGGFSLPVTRVTNDLLVFNASSGGYDSTPVRTSNPAFEGNSASDQDNIALNNDVTIIFGTERFDQAGNFASNTFTALVTGKYRLSCSVSFHEIDSEASNYTIKIITSNNSYFQSYDPRQFAADIAGDWSSFISIVADMDANDTAIVTIKQTAGTQQTDVTGGSTFSGYLAT